MEWSEWSVSLQIGFKYTAWFQYNSETSSWIELYCSAMTFVLLSFHDCIIRSLPYTPYNFLIHQTRCQYWRDNYLIN